MSCAPCRPIRESQREGEQERRRLTDLFPAESIVSFDRAGLVEFGVPRGRCGLTGGILGPVERWGWISARNEADADLCSPHGCDQRADTEDVHDAFEIVSQHVQSHFGADPFQSSHLEVGRPHPRLDGPERMLDGVEADVHSLRGLVEPLLDRLAQGELPNPFSSAATRTPTLLSTSAIPSSPSITSSLLVLLRAARMPRIPTTTARWTSQTPCIP